MLMLVSQFFGLASNLVWSNEPAQWIYEHDYLLEEYKH